MTSPSVQQRRRPEESAAAAGGGGRRAAEIAVILDGRLVPCTTGDMNINVTQQSAPQQQSPQHHQQPPQRPQLKPPPRMQLKPPQRQHKLKQRMQLKPKQQPPPPPQQQPQQLSPDQQPQQQQQQARRRIQRDRLHGNFSQASLFGMPDEEVRRRFRLPPHVIMDTLAIVQSDLEGNLASHTAIPPLTKLLVVLQFCATGSFQKSMGLATGMSQSSFSRVLRIVLRAFLYRRNHFINLPLDEDSLTSIKKQFVTIAGFPNVIGAVDATHIPLVPRGRNTFIFINRKNVSSLNVQVICDATQLIRSVVAKFPGSTQDSYVMRHSAIWQKLDQRHSQGGGDAWLLGDIAYPLKPFLLTPVLHPCTEEHVRYNMAHAATRQVVDRSIAILKARFKCLDQSGGALMYAPNIVCDIFVLCCIFHNIAVKHGVPFDEEYHVASDEEVEVEDEDDTSFDGHSDYREYVLEKYFS